MLVGTRHLEEEARGETPVGIERPFQAQPGDRGDERCPRRLDRELLYPALRDVTLALEDRGQAIGRERIEGEDVTHDRYLLASCR
jgi:hypothetical protein